MLQFLDGVESTREVSATAVTEELESEIEYIFQHLLKYIAHGLTTSVLNADDKEANDDKVISSETVSKVLHVCEILVQVQEKPFADECKRESIKR
ncbi:hypothetical protein EON65_05905 [archaeon]|nr:MAG: hypothetical protein EON65_05905 [archaeon]